MLTDIQQVADFESDVLILGLEFQGLNYWNGKVYMVVKNERESITLVGIRLSQLPSCFEDIKAFFRESED